MPNEIVPTDRRSVVLIVGGAGFLGTELSHRLLQGGQRVRILDPLLTPESEANLAWLAQRHGGSL